ncbi:MAG: hypothetical protein AAGF20_06740 [Pseudomonadota bacterium]
MMKKKGLFGAKAPVNIADQVGFGPMAEPEKQGTNWGAVGRHVAGSIGDAISRYYGGVSAYAPQLRQQQFFEQQAALQAERQRNQAQLAAFRATLPTAQQRNFQEFINMPQDQQQEFLQYQDMVNPLGQLGPDGRFYARPRVRQAPPTKPVGKLRPYKR